MGIIQRGSGKRPHHIDVEYQDRLDNEIQDCMKCRYFWGNNSRCISQKCFTERMPDKSDQKEQRDRDCEGCPYRQEQDYCFPCMKKILGRNKKASNEKNLGTIKMIVLLRKRRIIMDKNTVVIAIDHGWSNMKTVHETFTSGIREITTEPALFENVLEKDGKYYKVGSERLKVKDSKVEDENYYLLSLAATAKELERLGKRTANVYWAVGLPLTRFGKEKEAFIKYLDQNREVTFKYEKKQYHITIERISVYPQCFAAVASQISEFPAKVLVVDIGSWTVDLMPIINQSPDESVCVTKNSGIITCIQQINKECVRKLNSEVDEYDIQQVMLNGADDLPDQYKDIILEELHKYCETITNYIRELGYNMDLTPIIFVGGGATVMKRFGQMQQRNVRYIEDIRANAKGFDYLGKIYLERVIHRAG